jgi:hypothetical protein
MPQAKSATKKSKYDLEVILDKNFNIVIFVIVLMFLAAAYFLVIKPKFNSTLIGIKENVNQKEQFYRAQKQRLVDLEAAVTIYQKLQISDLEKIRLILPDEYAKEKLFGELEDIIAQQGVLVGSITLNKFGEPDEDKGAQTVRINNDRFANMPNSDRIGIIKIELSLGALDYNALKNIISLLESHLQLLDVHSLDFNPDEKTAVLSMYTYYFKQ